MAVLVVSHNMNDVFEVADRIAVLYLGRLVSGPGLQLRPPAFVDYMTSGAASASPASVAAASDPEEKRDGAREPPTPTPTGRTAARGRRDDEVEAPTNCPTASPEILANSSGEYFRAWGQRINNGESGAVPIIIGLIVIIIFFQLQQSSFLTAGNLVNLLEQPART